MSDSFEQMYVNPQLIITDTSLPLLVRHAAKMLQDRTYYTVQDLLDSLSTSDIGWFVFFSEGTIDVILNVKNIEQYTLPEKEAAKNLSLLSAIVSQAESLVMEKEEDILDNVFKLSICSTIYLSARVKNADIGTRLSMSLSFTELNDIMERLAPEVLK